MKPFCILWVSLRNILFNPIQMLLIVGWPIAGLMAGIFSLMLAAKLIEGFGRSDLIGYLFGALLVLLLIWGGVRLHRFLLLGEAPGWLPELPGGVMPRYGAWLALVVIAAALPLYFGWIWGMIVFLAIHTQIRDFYFPHDQPGSEPGGDSGMFTDITQADYVTTLQDMAFVYAVALILLLPAIRLAIGLPARAIGRKTVRLQGGLWPSLIIGAFVVTGTSCALLMLPDMAYILQSNAYLNEASISQQLTEARYANDDIHMFAYSVMIVLAGLILFLSLITTLFGHFGVGLPLDQPWPLYDAHR